MHCYPTFGHSHVKLRFEAGSKTSHFLAYSQPINCILAEPCLSALMRGEPVEADEPLGADHGPRHPEGLDVLVHRRKLRPARKWEMDAVRTQHLN